MVSNFKLVFNLTGDANYESAAHDDDARAAPGRQHGRPARGHAALGQASAAAADVVNEPSALRYYKRRACAKRLLRDKMNYTVGFVKCYQSSTGGTCPAALCPAAKASKRNSQKIVYQTLLYVYSSFCHLVFMFKTVNRFIWLE